MAKLPTVTSPLPRDLQQFVQRVREALDSGGPDAVVTARQLIAAGVVDSSAGGGVAPIGGTVDPPRAPSGLTASGALATIIVSWNGPQYKGHAYTEIWAHTSDLLGDAVLVGMTAGNNFAHNLGNAASRYYWVRNVNQNGVVSAFNATNGTQGATGQDPAYLLTVLTDEITATQLASSLGTRIDLIDGADTVVGSVNERVKIERLARQSSDSDINSALSSEESARQSADAATTSQVNNAISQTQNNAAAVISEQTTRADADAATASQLNGVVSETQTNSAAISSEITARTTATSAVAAQLVGMEATVNNNTAGLATELTTRAAGDSAVAAQTTVISASVASNSSAISSEITARANADASLASDITTLQTTTGGNTTSIQANATSIDGLEGQYTVKIDNNGHVSGFGLASTTVDGSRVSDFMVAADRFSVVNPTVAGGAITACFDASNNNQRYIIIPNAMWDSYTHASGDRLTIKGMGSRNNTYEIVSKGNYLNPSIGKALLVWGRSDEVPYTYLPDLPSANGQSYNERMAATYPEATGTINLSKEVPFIISTGSTQINGVTVPAGTYIDSAMIADATIKNAQIGSLTADKITASLLNTVDFYGNTIAGASIYLGGTVTYNQANGVNTGIQSIASPKVEMTSTGAVFAVDAFTINNPGGTDVVPFSITSDVVSIDSALIKDGTITNAMIGNTIQSTDFAAGSAGWRIKKNGNAELNNATFRGTLDVGGSSGSRMTITSTKLRVYDGNTLRVKIGDLS